MEKAKREMAEKQALADIAARKRAEELEAAKPAEDKLPNLEHLASQGAGVADAMADMNAKALQKQANDLAAKTGQRQPTTEEFATASGAQSYPQAHNLTSTVKPMRTKETEVILKCQQPQLNFFYKEERKSFSHRYFMSDDPDLIAFIEANFKDYLDASGKESGPLETPAA